MTDSVSSYAKEEIDMRFKLIFAAVLIILWSGVIIDHFAVKEVQTGIRAELAALGQYHE